MQFGAKPLFENVSVKFGNGNRYGLIGANGCGKSTFMKILGGDLEPSGGQVMLEPNVRLGKLRQDQFAYEQFSVIDTVIMGHEELWKVKAERDRIYSLPEMSEEDGMAVAELETEFAEMDGYTAESRAGELLLGLGIPLEQHFGPMTEVAPGWKLRVLLAQALFSDPEVLLLDEPMSNLDAKLREEMHIELRAIQRELGITTILVTHDQVEAMTMSDRIAVMQRGRIVQIDTPFEAYERPHSPFASDFLGKTNAFAGAVQLRNERCCHVQVRDTLLHVPHEDRSLGQDVNVYIRPEKIRLTEPGLGRINGRIALRVFLGNLWLLAVDSHFGLVHLTQPNLGHVPCCWRRCC